VKNSIFILGFLFLVSCSSLLDETAKNSLRVPASEGNISCLEAVNSILKKGQIRGGVAQNSFLNSKVKWKSYKSLEDLEINDSNLKWQRMLVKDSEQVITEATLSYIKNVTGSLEDFDKTLNSPNLAENFIEAFKRQHTHIMTGGNDTGTSYSGYLHSTIESKDLTHLSGQYRTKSQILALRLYLDPDELENLEIAKKVEVIGIPEKAWPFNNSRELDGKRIVHHSYAEAQDIAMYVEKLRDLAVKITDCHDCTNQEVLNLIADYYHTGINAHIFTRVNNSLLMSEVNYFLYRISMKGIMHGKIDIYALTMGTTKFQKYFIDLIQKAQN
jgi:hypothetical protein